MVGYRYLAVRFLLRERANTWRLANKEKQRIRNRQRVYTRSINQKVAISLRLIAYIFLDTYILLFLYNFVNCTRARAIIFIIGDIYLIFNILIYQRLNTNLYKPIQHSLFFLRITQDQDNSSIYFFRGIYIYLIATTMKMTEMIGVRN